MKKYKRAKNLVNVGEISKAVSAILSDGVAKVDAQVLTQLRLKHPSRPAPVRLPSMKVIEAERATWLEDLYIVEDADEVDSKLESISEHSKNEGDPVDKSKRFPWLVINEEDILSAAKKAKRLTAGGLQQITPWLLKRAFLEDTTNECAIIAGQVATRWGRGDFSSVLGELVAESQLIALYKDENRKDVRPVSVGCSLRRLLTRAYCAQIREIITSHVEATQIGVLKGGYEIGIHSMRELARKASKKGWVVVLLDFANAFNTVDRNLMLRLVAAHCPELTNLVRWLYELEPHLVTGGGDTVRSSTGTQQGCTLSNPLFALTMEYIAKK